MVKKTKTQLKQIKTLKSKLAKARKVKIISPLEQFKIRQKALKEIGAGLRTRRQMTAQKILDNPRASAIAKAQAKRILG